MTTRKLTISQIILIGLNLLPILGVWFQGWDAARIFLFYCLETILVGIFHVFKMILTLILSRPADDSNGNAGQQRTVMMMGLFIVVFFIMHYGIFVFVQTSMFFAVSGVYKGGLSDLSPATLQQLLGREGMLMIILFIAYYTFQTIKDISLSGINKMSDLVKMMFQPYLRVFVQQFVLILGSMFLVFGLGNIFILVFILVKLYIEIRMNRGDRISKALEENEIKTGKLF